MRSHPNATYSLITLWVPTAHRNTETGGWQCCMPVHGIYSVATGWIVTCKFGSAVCQAASAWKCTYINVPSTLVLPAKDFRAIYCSPREISLNIVTDIRPEYVLYTKKPDFPFHGTARPFYLECSQSAFADQVVGTYQHFQFFNFRLLDITYPHPYTMNLFHILNPPGEFPRQMPPTIDIHRHVTQGSTSPHPGLESAQSQSGSLPGNGIQIGAGWPFPHHLPSAEQLAPIPIPLAQLPTDP
ncbi:hypothetical protein E4U48_005737, partial [Claviceps purpurea]